MRAYLFTAKTLYKKEVKTARQTSLIRARYNFTYYNLIKQLFNEQKQVILFLEECVKEKMPWLL